MIPLVIFVALAAACAPNPATPTATPTSAPIPASRFVEVVRCWDKDNFPIFTYDSFDKLEETPEGLRVWIGEQSVLIEPPHQGRCEIVTVQVLQ